MCDFECVNGVCIQKNSTHSQCQCSLSFQTSSSVCGLKYKLIFLEFSVALFIFLTFLIFLKNIFYYIFHLLCIPETASDYVFPRTQPTKSIMKISPKGRWKWLLPLEGKGIVSLPRGEFRYQSTLIFPIIMIELFLEWFQYQALLFIPIVPWNKTYGWIRNYLLILLFYEMDGAVTDYHSYSGVAYSLGIIGLIIGFLVVYLTNMYYCPILKPQKEGIPSENAATFTLRLFSSWLFIPISIQLLLPLRCILVGYQPNQQSWFGIPSLDSCWTWQTITVSLIGIILTFLYMISCLLIGIQLHCETSVPFPTLWTDSRFIESQFLAKFSIVLAVVSFSKTNPFLLLMILFFVSIYNIFVNYRLRPCIYLSINHMRMILNFSTAWSAICGLLLSTNDYLSNPTSDIMFFIWWLGTVGIFGGGFIFSRIILRFFITEEMKVSYEIDSLKQRHMD